MRCPVTYLIVTIEKKLYDSVTFKSGQKLFIDPSWHPEEYAMMEAEVIGVPGRTGFNESDALTYGYKGFSIPMRPGDKILMNYAVTTSYIDQPDRDTPIYKNLFIVDGKEYWKCALGHVYAYIRDSIIHMVNGWVMGDIIEEEVIKSSIIITPDNVKAVRYKDRMRVRHIGPNLPYEPRLRCIPGNLVYVDPKYVIEYKINEDEFYLTRQSRILGYA